MSKQQTKYYVIDITPVSIIPMVPGLFDISGVPTPLFVTDVVWERVDARIAPQEYLVVGFTYTKYIEEALHFSTIDEVYGFMGDVFVNWDFITLKREPLPQVLIKRVLWDNTVVSIDSRLKRNK